MICIYCSKEIPEGQERMSVDGPSCFDCCGDPSVYNQPEISGNPENSEQDPEPETQETNEEDAQAMLNLLNAMKELQFVRLRQIQSGETDQVIMKRTLPEILIMMEDQIAIAKTMVTKLEPEATLQSRFFMISALTYGLAYLSTHPVPHT